VDSEHEVLCFSMRQYVKFSRPQMCRKSARLRRTEAGRTGAELLPVPEHVAIRPYGLHCGAWPGLLCHGFWLVSSLLVWLCRVNDVLSGRQECFGLYRVTVMYVIDVEDLSVQRAGHPGAQVFTIPGLAVEQVPLWLAHRQ
jgi:hypothetical protein